MDASLALLIIAWVAYLAVHSWLATNSVKQGIQGRFHFTSQQYRLLYVIFASVSLLPVVYLIIIPTSESLWQHQGIVKILLDGLSVLALVGFILVARSYNMMSFMGVTSELDKDSFKISWLHRFVRHPWYFFGLIIIWSRDMNTAWLVSCICITAYLIIGSRLEDNKLIEQYGARYQTYKEKIPGLIAIPGCYLSRQEVDKIESM